MVLKITMRGKALEDVLVVGAIEGTGERRGGGVKQTFEGVADLVAFRPCTL